MSSQSDDFARMIYLLEQILERLPPKPQPVYGTTYPTMYGPSTSDYVCPNCVGGTCQCNTGAA